LGLKRFVKTVNRQIILGVKVLTNRCLPMKISNHQFRAIPEILEQHLRYTFMVPARNVIQKFKFLPKIDIFPQKFLFQILTKNG